MGQVKWLWLTSLHMSHDVRSWKCVLLVCTAIIWGMPCCEGLQILSKMPPAISSRQMAALHGSSFPVVAVPCFDKLSP
eukprot:123220-Amphidinium_carterae.1